MEEPKLHLVNHCDFSPNDRKHSCMLKGKVEINFHLQREKLSADRRRQIFDQTDAAGNDENKPRRSRLATAARRDLGPCLRGRIEYGNGWNARTRERFPGE
jgi:hypothetical protein